MLQSRGGTQKKHKKHFETYSPGSLQSLIFLFFWAFDTSLRFCVILILELLFFVGTSSRFRSKTLQILEEVPRKPKFKHQDAAKPRGVPKNKNYETYSPGSPDSLTFFRTSSRFCIILILELCFFCTSSRFCSKTLQNLEEVPKKSANNILVTCFMGFCFGEPTALNILSM